MVGCIFYELCTLRRPFEGESWSIVINKIIYSQYLELGKEYPPVFNQLLDMMLQKKACLRASVDEILSIPIISN
jgi:serine/threonine protein kinase